jgi:CheY-like chemotaxis protein
MTSNQVLVVEDDEGIRELLADFVRSEGYRVETASNGLEALTLLRSSAREPCCILLDLMMPVMSGWEFLEVCHESDRLVTIPVVVLSGEARGHQPGVARVFKKPVAVEQLLDVVREFCGPGQGCVPPPT